MLIYKIETFSKIFVRTKYFLLPRKFEFFIKKKTVDNLFMHISVPIYNINLKYC